MEHSQTSPSKDHCLIFYDGRKLNITTSEFLGVASAMEDLNNKFLEIRGAKYPINDIKFAGTRMDWASLSDKDPVPVGQNTASLPFSPYALLGGNVELKKGLVWGKYESEQFKEMAVRQAKEHRDRQPDIDEALRKGNCIHCYQPIDEQGQLVSKLTHVKCTEEKIGVDMLETRDRDFPPLAHK